MMKRLACLCIAVFASVLSVASSAMANQHHPKGIFAPFADCSLNNPAVTLCLVAKISSGEMVLGRKGLPISKTITIQAGLIEAGGTNPNEYLLAGAEDGQVLSKTALGVPGGLAGVGAAGGTNEVKATAELANTGTPDRLNLAALFLEEGVGLLLPLKVKLENPLLGSNCYVGSNARPIVLELLDGRTDPPVPNKPITGRLGTFFEEREEPERALLADDGVLLVENAFSVPAVSGCVGVYPSLIDTDVGLPSPMGRNSARMSISMELATAAFVKASE